MDNTLQIVQEDAIDVVEPVSEEIGVAAPIEDESDGVEPPELSIEELEEYFRALDCGGCFRRSMTLDNRSEPAVTKRLA